MKPEIISHESYQNFILKQLNEHYSNGILVLVNKDWALILKLWLTDLSYVSTLLDSSYSTKGPKPRDPSAMMRSYLIFLLTRPSIGITEWVDELHRVLLRLTVVLFTLHLKIICVYLPKRLVHLINGITFIKDGLL